MSSTFGQPFSFTTQPSDTPGTGTMPGYTEVPMMPGMGGTTPGAGQRLSIPSLPPLTLPTGSAPIAELSPRTAKAMRSIKEVLGESLPRITSIPEPLLKMLGINKPAEVAKMGIIQYALAEREKGSTGPLSRLFKSKRRKKVAVVATYNSIYVVDASSGIVHRLILYCDIEKVILIKRDAKGKDAPAEEKDEESEHEGGGSSLDEAISLLIKVKEAHDVLLRFTPSMQNELEGAANGPAFCKVIREVYNKTNAIKHEEETERANKEAAKREKAKAQLEEAMRPMMEETLRAHGLQPGADPAADAMARQHILAANPELRSMHLAAEQPVAPPPPPPKALVVDNMTVSSMKEARSMANLLPRGATDSKSAVLKKLKARNEELMRHPEPEPEPEPQPEPESEPEPEVFSPRAIGGSLQQHEALLQQGMVAGGVTKMNSFNRASVEDAQDSSTTDEDSKNDDHVAVMLNIIKRQQEQGTIDPSAAAEEIEQQVLAQYYEDLYLDPSTLTEEQKSRMGERAARATRRFNRERKRALRRQIKQLEQLGSNPSLGADQVAAVTETVSGLRKTLSQLSSKSQSRGPAARSQSGLPNDNIAEAPPLQSTSTLPRSRGTSIISRTQSKRPEPEKAAWPLSPEKFLEQLMAVAAAATPPRDGKEGRRRRNRHSKADDDEVSVSVSSNSSEESEESDPQSKAKRSSKRTRRTKNANMPQVSSRNADNDASSYNLPSATELALRQEIALLAAERDSAQTMLTNFLNNSRALGGDVAEAECTRPEDLDAMLSRFATQCNADDAISRLVARRTDPMIGVSSRSSSPIGARQPDEEYNWRQRYLREHQLSMALASRCDALERAVIREREEASKERDAALVSQQRRYESLLLVQHDEIAVLREGAARAALLSTSLNDGGDMSSRAPQGLIADASSTHTTFNEAAAAAIARSRLLGTGHRSPSVFSNNTAMSTNTAISDYLRRKQQMLGDI